MKSSLDCIPCFIRQAMEAAHLITDDEKIIGRSIRKILFAASNFDLSYSPPVMGHIIHQILREESGCSDPYRNIKKISIEKTLMVSDSVMEEIKKTEFPFLTAVKYSIAGNILDFALLPDLNDDRIKKTFTEVIHKKIDEGLTSELFNKIQAAEKVLVLGDNAGESVYDKLLIEFFPGKAKIYYAVKDSPVINDAVYEDAVNSGLDKVSIIISNGYNAPGTVLDKCSKEFLDIYNSADVVISKGQGNLETLFDTEREIYFLTQIKCPVIADRSGFNFGDWVITKTSLLDKNNENR